MKCPKCHYLGFETGDRCKNCGYDFSLLTADPAPPELELTLRDPDPFEPGSHQWLDQLDRGLDTAPALPRVERLDPLAPLPVDTVVAAPSSASASVARAVAAGRLRHVGSRGDPTSRAGSSARDAGRPGAQEATQAAPRAVTPPLPLFQPGSDDEPLIKVPASPRPPLAVRRTPQRPKLRAVPKPVPHADTALVRETDPEPVLAFSDEPAADAPLRHDRPSVSTERRIAAGEVVTAPRRFAAAALDLLLLAAIDLVIIYFTLKMAALPLSAWPLLPPLPLLTFLGLVKLAYVYAFTLVGGQTIGKMAAHIRVVADDGAALDPPRAIRRTLAGAVSLLALGIGFFPILLAADRRALHDRMARTRVVTQ